MEWITEEHNCDNSKCQNCGINEATDHHTCPYREEIDVDSETMCNCCSGCEHECAMDI